MGPDGTLSMWEGIAAFGAMLAAADRAARGHRRSSEVADFLVERERNVLELVDSLRSGSWSPSPFRTFEILEPKRRTISATTFSDRVVHHALCAAIEPVLERHASPMSFACRRGRGTVAAVRAAQALARRHAWYLKLDVHHYFETVAHDALMARMRKIIWCERTTALCETIIRFGAPGSEPGRGLPIGNLTSQHFANDFLSQVDHHVLRALRMPGAVRYMDDIVLFADDAQMLRDARDGLHRWLPARLDLAWKPTAERFGPTLAGVPFLGFRIWPGHIRLDAARRTRVARRLRSTMRRLDAGDITEVQAAQRLASVCAWSDLGRAARFRASVISREF